MVAQSIPTLPPAELLQLLDAQMQANPAKARPGRCRIWLSGALCPVVPLNLPQGVRGWEERKSFAQAAAAQVLALDADTLDVELVQGSNSLAAAVSHPLRQMLAAWSAGQGWAVASTSPLWTLATQLAEGADALVLQEPDSVSAFATDSAGQTAAMTWPGTADSGTLINANRWLVGTASADQPVVRRLGFAAVGTTNPITRPVPLADHWGAFA